MEDLPSPCFAGASSNGYAKKHDPFMYFDDVSTSPSRCSNVVPLASLHSDLAANRLPRFAWISPNLCHDMHDCSVATGDRFLSTLIPPLLRALGSSGVLFLTWDEGSTDRGCCGAPGGGHVAMIVAGPLVPKGTRAHAAFTHYSLLRTIEATWHLGYLGFASCTCTTSMAEFFSHG
jgi:hypothetical protein